VGGKRMDFWVGPGSGTTLVWGAGNLRFTIKCLFIIVQVDSKYIFKRGSEIVLWRPN
jgi:hypothetical protein